MRTRLIAALAAAATLCTFVVFLALPPKDASANNGGAATGSYLAQTTVETGDTVANTTTATTLTSGLVVAAGELSVGRTLMFVYGGIVSDTVTPTLTLDCLDGTTVAWTTGATTLATTITNLSWTLNLSVTCVTAGASGLVNYAGRCNMGATNATLPAVGATPVTGTLAYDTTVSHTYAIRVTWGTASASNTITQRYAFPFLGN